MKRNQFIWGVIMSTLILVTSCGKSNQQKDNENILESTRKSLWTDSLKQLFIKENDPKTDFEKFVLTELIAENEFIKKPNELNDFIQSSDFNNYKLTKSKNYIVVIDSLVGKSEKEIEKLIGQPNSKEQVSPSGTPCPCNKNIYIYDLIEIVFINDKADWITVNNKSNFVLINNIGNYQSVDLFEDYAYVKAFTK